MIKKVLLIAPPAITFRSVRDINPLPPMGLGYLASVVEGMGIEVRILDCLMDGWGCEENVDDSRVKVGLPDEDVLEIVREYSPDVVGVNCQFSRQHRIYHQMFSLIKRAKQDCVVVAGGAHTTVCPRDVLGNPDCDYILIGEAETSFKDFILFLDGRGDVGCIDGLGWKQNGNMAINDKRTVIADLDSIPFPAYHLMNLQKYHGLNASHGLRHKRRFCPIITSRGCPAKCTFCSAHRVWGRKFRARSVDNVIAEMRLLKREYGVEELMFEDDNVTANPMRAKELFARMIDEQLNFVWDTPNGVGIWSMDEEMIRLMKRSGCVKLNFPVESGSQRVLNEVVRKPLRLEKVKGLIQYCRDIDLDCGMFLVVGLPGETLDDIRASFRFAGECGCFDPHISVATPYPGTDLFDKCTKENLLSKEFSLDDLFIRSYMIRTADWDAKDLSRMLLKGHLGLRLRDLMDNPLRMMRRIVAKIVRVMRVQYGDYTRRSLG